MKDKSSVTQCVIALHRGYEGQNEYGAKCNCPSSRVWRTKWAWRNMLLSFIEGMKDKMSTAQSAFVLHHGNEGQNECGAKCFCPSSRVWRTKWVRRKVLLSFIMGMKDKMSAVQSVIVLHRGYEGQNECGAKCNCPSSREWRTKWVRRKVLLSFIRGMKDKMSVTQSAFVLHRGYEGQNECGGTCNCPSSRLWRTNRAWRNALLSFIRGMKDKMSAVQSVIVLHQGYEGQIERDAMRYCPSSRVWRTKWVRRKV